MESSGIPLRLFAILGIFTAIAGAYFLFVEEPPYQGQKEGMLTKRFPGEVGELQGTSPYCSGTCYFKRGEISVMFRDGIQKETAFEVIGRLGYEVASSSLWSPRSTVITVPRGKEGEAIERLRRESLVIFAEYNYIRDISANNPRP